jgi:hypothetical protein
VIGEVAAARTTLVNVSAAAGSTSTVKVSVALAKAARFPSVPRPGLPMPRPVALLAALLLATIPAVAGGQKAAKPARSVTFLHFNDIYEITPLAGGTSGGCGGAGRSAGPALIKRDF